MTQQRREQRPSQGSNIRSPSLPDGFLPAQQIRFVSYGHRARASGTAAPRAPRREPPIRAHHPPGAAPPPCPPRPPSLRGTARAGARAPPGVDRGAGMDAWRAAWQALGLLLAYPALVGATRVLRSAWQGWRLRRLPSPPHGALGVVGALVARRDRHRLVLEWARALGPVFHIRQVLKHTVVCTDPAVVAAAVRCKQLDKGVTTRFENKVWRIVWSPRSSNPGICWVAPRDVCLCVRLCSRDL